MDHPAAPAADARFYSVKPPPYIACMHGRAGHASIPYHTYVDRHIPDIHMYVHSQMFTTSGCTFSLCVVCVSMTKQLPGSRNTTASNYEALAS